MTIYNPFRFSKFMPNGINCELLTEGAFRGRARSR